MIKTYGEYNIRLTIEVRHGDLVITATVRDTVGWEPVAILSQAYTDKSDMSLALEEQMRKAIARIAASMEV